MEPWAGRSTEQVILNHLENRRHGRIEEDLALNYAPDVVVLTSRGIFRGHDGVRRLQRMLRHALGDAAFEHPMKLCDGAYAFVEWRSRCAGARVEDGADSFVVRDGRIVAQTVHYTVETVMPD